MHCERKIASVMAELRAFPPTLTRRSGRAWCELRDPEEVVGGPNEVRGHLGSLRALVASAPEVRDRLRPAEDLLDALPETLADGVAGMSSRAAVDAGAAMLGDVLSDVGGDVHVSTSSDEVDYVVVLIASHRHVANSVDGVSQHLKGDRSLGGSVRFVDSQVN